MSDDGGIFGSILGLGTAAATGNPIGAITSLIGLGTSIFGTSQQAAIAKETAAVSAANAGLEERVDDQKHQAMVLSSRRQQMENFRNTQRARAAGLNASVNQGAQFGSGEAGGQAQAADQGGYNALGINQNTQIGNNIFGFNNQIDQNKIKLASLGGDAASAAGLTAIGGDITKASGSFGNLFGSLGGNSSSSAGSTSVYNSSQPGPFNAFKLF